MSDDVDGVVVGGEVGGALDRRLVSVRSQSSRYAGQGKVQRRGEMLDVYLNDRAYWKDVPLEVWEYRLGGYQMLKKRVSYRESKLLGRGSGVGEVGWRVAGTLWPREDGQ